MSAISPGNIIGGAAGFGVFGCVLCLAVPFDNEPVRLGLLFAVCISLAVVLGKFAAAELRPLARQHPHVPRRQEHTVVPIGDDEYDHLFALTDVSPHAFDGQPATLDARVSGFESQPHVEKRVSSALVPRAVPPTTSPQPAPPPVQLGCGVNVGFAKWTVAWTCDGYTGEIPLPSQGGDISVGRGSHNDIIIGHPQVSTNHLRIICRTGSDTLQVLDLGSSNGSALLRSSGDIVLPPRQLHAWDSGSEVVIPGHPPAMVRLRLIRRHGQ